jgi:hypothetical protein
MIVQRFMNWLRLKVAGSLRNSAEQHTREPVLAGSRTPAYSLEQSPPTLSLSSWLDNGRRLRPRLRLPASTREIAASTTRPLRSKTQPPTPQRPEELPIPPAPPARIAPASFEVADLAPTLSPKPESDDSHDSQSDELGELEQLDAETRRLMVLRHLVRRRVFNEGFTAENVPPQYQRSLGMDAPPQE